MRLARLADVREQRRGLAFPGADGKAPFGGWSKSKAKLDRDSKVADWRLHDLRRTVATGLQRLGGPLGGDGGGVEPR